MARHTLYPRPNYSPYHTHVCGCYIYHPEDERRTYLPQVKLDAHTTILSTASRTVVTQSFFNSSKESLDEIRYAFPLYDGVSVVDFYCEVGERKIYGLVKEKSQARKTYEEAKERGESAALLEQLPDAADVFTTAISNIPAGASVRVTVKYVQELKHDAEVDGVRLTIPTSIAPRYGDYPGELQKTNTEIDSKGISITVDVSMAEGVPVKKIISPSHPIQVAFGSLSNSPADEDPSLSRGSASLALDTAELEKDFVLQVVVKDVGIPQAILETHPTLPNQRALMTTLVPKFNIKSQKPEIILIADRSGSMDGQIPTLKSALNVFLKSIPLGCTFNICSFGSRYEFLWPKSKIYEESTLEKAIAHVKNFDANFGGTETLKALKACFAARTTDSPTELILLTDGDIWSQQELFETVSRETKSGNVRVFALGIGRGVSSSLIEGVARAGRGFAQMVADNEKLDGKIVRMLKGALTPHINDYRLEVKYEDDSVESVAESLRVRLNISDSNDSTKDKEATETKPISLYDPDAKEEHPKEGESNDLFAGLPELKRPTLLQTPHEIPALFPFHRTCVYLLMAPESSHLNPKSVILKGTSSQGPLQIEIPVQQRKDPDEMIHQLAARKATQELEEGHGWISDATSDDTGALIKEKYPTQYELLQRREAVRFGVEFQVGGKYCSFVAVEANEAEIAERKQKAISSTLDRSARQAEEEDWEVIPEPAQPIPRKGTKAPRRTLASKACRKSAPSTGGLAVKKKPRKRVSTSTRDPWTTKKKKRKVANKDSGSASRSLPMSNSLLMMSAPSASVGGGRGGATAGMGRGGAMRHRMTGGALLCSAGLTEESVQVDEKEEEDEDEDMGFGLYDEDLGTEAPAGFSPISHYSGGSPGSVVNAVASSAPSPGYSPTSPVSPPSKKQKVVPEEQEEEDDGHDDDHNEVKPEGPLLNRLIAHQSFAGSWSPLSSIPFSELQVDASAVGNTVKKFAADSKIAGSARDAEQIVATAVVVLFLERKMASEEETWELVVEKARSWLEDKVTNEEGLEEVWKVAGELVGA